MLDDQYLNVPFKLDSSSDSFGTFLDNAGVPENMKNIILNDDMATITFTQDGNTLTSHSNSKIRNETIAFTDGEIFEYIAPHGKKFKGAVAINGNNVTHTSTEKPDHYVKMDFDGDTLIITLQEDDITATRTFKKA